MRKGNLTINLITDGSFLQDGGAVFGQLPKALWEGTVKTDRRNRMRLGLNTLLIRSPGRNILIDTGVGSKETESKKEFLGLSRSKLLKGLKDFDISPRDIDIVILTHLHFDHCGGSTKLDSSGKALPTFPKATYFVQEVAWEKACNPSEREQAFYHPDDFEPLLEKKQLELLKGNTEIVPGVWTQVTNGHCQGHQMVLISPWGERIAFPGDLVPTPYHVELSCITAFDHSPEVTLEQKRSFLSKAMNEGWLVIYSHGYEQRAGYIDRKNGGWQSRPTEV